MKKLLLSAAVFGLFASQARLSQGQAPAVAPGANAPRYGIAVVDISFVFKKYPRFTAAIESLKTEMEAADSDLKSDRDRLVQMEEQRNTLKPGSVEFKQLDEQLAQQKAAFSIKQGTIRRDFLEKEAKIYYETYQEVSDAVTRFAQQHNIGLVLRFNGDQIDPNQREDVMRAITQPIVHQNNIDITPDVLLVLGVDVRSPGSSGAQGVGGVKPVANRPQQTQQR